MLTRLEKIYPIQKRLYAVAVRDSVDLILFLSVCRAPQGDVYINFPRDYEPGFKPHSSFHASGQHHQKSFGNKFGVRHCQRPDAEFRGTENIVTTGISIEDLHADNTPCLAESFDDVFEISFVDLRPEKYLTYISVDISESNGESIITPGGTIIRQAVYQDFVPWIIVTLFDTSSEVAKPLDVPDPFFRELASTTFSGVRSSEA